MQLDEKHAAMGDDGLLDDGDDDDKRESASL
jgi:hypothetical protein